MSTVEPVSFIVLYMCIIVSGCVLVPTCPKLYKVHTDNLGCLLLSLYYTCVYVRLCPWSYMSEGIQSTHRQPGMSTIKLVYIGVYISGCVLGPTCPKVYKVHTDNLGCLLLSLYT